MNQAVRERKVWGTRTVEAVAAVAIVALFAVVVPPAVQTLRRHEAIKRVVAQGLQLRETILAANMAAEESEALTPLWPTNGFTSSTMYFKKLFTSNLYTNDFPAGLLAAPGVPACPGTNIAAFARANNAWCIARPLANQTNDFPFLFTRNFLSAKPHDATLADIRQLDPDQTPFGNDAGIVITYRGESLVIRASDLVGDVKLEMLFNPGSVTNGFLSP